MTTRAVFSGPEGAPAADLIEEAPEVEAVTERAEAKEEAEERTGSEVEAGEGFFFEREVMEVMEGLDFKAAAAVMLEEPPGRPALARTSGEGVSSRCTVGLGCLFFGCRERTGVSSARREESEYNSATTRENGGRTVAVEVLPQNRIKRLRDRVLCELEFLREQPPDHSQEPIQFVLTFANRGKVVRSVDIGPVLEVSDRLHHSGLQEEAGCQSRKSG